MTAENSSILIATARNHYLKGFNTKEELFYSYVDKTVPPPDYFKDSGNCWAWEKTQNGKGYGMFWWSGRMVAAHRVSWLIKHEKITDGMEICHHCDNRLCCNVDHLFEGTRQDNMRDMISKNRGKCATGDNHWTRKFPERVPRGENHGSKNKPESIRKGSENSQAKITEADVIEIRRLTHIVSGVAIARKFGITPATVWKIVHRYNWIHI